MKLYGAVSGVKICGVDQTKLANHENPILITNTPPSLGGLTSYVSIGEYSILAIKPEATPATNWVALGSIGSDNKADFLYIRDRIIAVFVEYATAGVPITDLPEGEQKAILEYMAAEKLQLESVFTNLEINKATDNYLPLAEEARQLRFNAVKSLMVQNFGRTGTRSISSDIKPTRERDEYILEGDTGLVDYLNSTGDYAGAGFIENASVAAEIAARTQAEIETVRDDAIAILTLGVTSNDEFYKIAN